MGERPQPDPSCPSCAVLSDRLDELDVLVRELGAEVTRLKARKPPTSRTSSKPPSSDAPWSKAARRKKSPSGKKRGGQPGHEGRRRRPGPPEDVSQSSFGPNLSGLIATLTGGYRMSRRSVQRFVADSFGIDISLGALSGVEARISEGLAGAHADAMASVAESPVKHLDETPWTESNKSAWVWTAVGEDATVFVIRDT